MLVYMIARHCAFPRGVMYLFNRDELANFEYELDILMDGAFGYNLPGNMGPFLGTIFVNKLIERFSDSTGNASAVYLEFGHDTTIDTAFAALGLAKDTPPLSATGPVPPNRAFRTSTQVPFGAQMVWEKFTCTSSFNGPQIRLIMNDSPFPLSACAGTEQDGAYGSCSFDKFVDSNALSTSVSWGRYGMECNLRARQISESQCEGQQRRTRLFRQIIMSFHFRRDQSTSSDSVVIELLLNFHNMDA